MKPGDPVVYSASPRLYGEMEVAQVRKGGKVLCIIDPDARRPSFEVFDADELGIGELTA